MPRHRPQRQPVPLPRSVGLPLAGGILMLALLYQLIVWARNAENWQWLVRKPSATATASQSSKPARKTSPLPEATGPTDEDPDQAEMAREEFQALTDGATRLGPEEMVPYDRLVFWVKNQSFARLDRRAHRDLWFTDLYDQPEKHRGQLVALDVDIRRAKDVGKNQYGVRLFEVWCATQESRSRLYDLIVLDYPKDMPQGYDIHENARFAGYFLKLQGYEPANARPGQRPEKAPLLIGRLQWTPPAEPAVEESEPQWFWGMAAAAIVGIGIVVWFFESGRRGRKASRQNAMARSDAPDPIDHWLGPDHGEEQ